MANAVLGIEECCADLRRVPPAVCGVGLVRGLHAAAEVIEREVSLRTPTRTNRVGGDQDYPALVTDLQVRVTVDSQFRGGVAQIGFFRNAYIANWLEFGHRMVGHGSSKPARNAAWKAGGEKMVPAHPFMRPGADAAQEPAVEAFIDAVDDSLKEFSNG
jgi:hypothetical protein